MAADFLERMGERIRRRREELGLSRPEVARRMPGKVNENQVYRWENGLHQPKPDTLEALAVVLRCDVAHFVVPAPDKTTTPDFLGGGDGNGLERRVEELTGLVRDLRERLDLLSAETAARDAEVLRRLEEGLPPTGESQQ